MISGVASQRIPMNARFTEHIDRCLTCRACEVVCPNHVAYGRLIDGARVMVSTLSTSELAQGVVARKKSWLRDVLEKVFIDKSARLDRLRPFIYFFQKIGVQERLLRSALVRGTKLGLLLSKLPLIRFPRHEWQEIYPAVGAQRGEVALFLGCIARLIDTETNLSAIFVLNRLGYTVHVPTAQTCCGALYQHSGRMTAAAQLNQQNKQAFADLKLDAIISTASGCGAHLAECCAQYRTENFSAPIVDINKFLVEQDWNEVKIKPLPEKVAVHDPCSLRNVMQASNYPYQLLAHIPGIELAELAGNNQCCGAAGTYFLDQPEIAEALLNEKMTAWDGVEAHCLVTSNIGCSFHLASGLGSLKQRGEKIELLHPVTLLARQMGIQ